MTLTAFGCINPLKPQQKKKLALDCILLHVCLTVGFKKVTRPSLFPHGMKSLLLTVAKMFSKKNI